MSEKEEIIKFYNNNPQLFISAVSKYYPLSFEFLKDHDGVWDWFYVSQNKSIDWSEDYLCQFSDKLDWYQISCNPSIKWSIPLLDCFKERLHWLLISNNTGGFWTTELIGHFKSRLNWKLNMDSRPVIPGLSINPSLPWSPEFMWKYRNKIEWSNCWGDKDLTITSNESIIWTEDLIIRFEKYLDWNWFSGNENIRFTEKTIERFENKWNWDRLSSNKAVLFTSDLIEKYKEKWYWRNLSQNPNLPWSVSLIEKYIDKWSWGLDSYGGMGLSLNKGLPWDTRLILKFYNKWAWDILSINPYLPWDLSFFESNLSKWSWKGSYWETGYAGEVYEHGGVSYNSKLPLSKEHLLLYYNQWSWKDLSANTGNFWNKELIDFFEKVIDFEELINNPIIKWDKSLVLKYIHKFELDRVILKYIRDIDLEFINTNNEMINLDYYPNKLVENPELWQKIFQPLIDDGTVELFLMKYYSSSK